ncbi:EEIG1/EHBP1 protein amino-terminal domain protein [Perilla frutescens var. hirtella]|uniref:EEIG1/EHBP1 protein amino-terminal domain protein n=1 Tax=Perilla frutescens var. hirtella TaxID=608512 RepID=A0AAD4JJU6_PERFH|nr:EEIG1/EHBP1 protein amino-terminal domain protein [Perilla frutescens var. hirtella]
MVQGPRTKTRKTPSVQLDYIVHIQEIKPWPPSQSLRTIRAALIQWEHGDKNSGSTNQVVPLVEGDSGVGDGKIEFNESFRLPVMLLREKLIKGGNGDTFQKNCIEFNLYEPRRDKAVKGQLLGTAVVDLAEYGIIRESSCISAPINCKRTYRNTAQPLLFLKIQPFERSSRSSSSRDNLMREASMDRNNFESVSALSEEYADEADVASFTTDDDASSHSSLAVTSAAAESNGSSSPQNKDNRTAALNDSAGEAKSDEDRAIESHVKPEGNSSRSSSVESSSDLAWISNKILSRSYQSPAPEEMVKPQSSNNEVDEHKNKAEVIQENVLNGGNDVQVRPNSMQGISTSAEETRAHPDHQRDEDVDSVLSHKQDDDTASTGTEDPETGRTNSPQNGLIDSKIIEKHQNYTDSEVDVQNQVARENGLHSATGNNNFSTADRMKQGKSVRSMVDSSRSNGPVRSNRFLVADAQNHSRGSISSESKDAKICEKDINKPFSHGRIQNLERRMKILEEELREAAAIEVSLYSVVAEHGSSMTKVHAPARRLSRLYFHASKLNLISRRGSAAKSIVSGLALVSKACGNDVPRLTFWLSNSIVLRVIVSKFFGESKLPISIGPVTGTVGDSSGKRNSSPLKWDSFTNKSTSSDYVESFGNWEEPLTFVAALEKVEAWIFTRIIESIWWQTFTPHMQSGTAKEIPSSVDSEPSKLYQRTSSSVDQQQGSFSLELWKNAFRDACERICPVRAGGHDCGCLPVLSKVIMEQLIARLDVAMFNAILRESADEIPTDPVADPISDAEVLPIPAGKASFGAGAQLKNAIGNWSRWLTDIFGVDEDDLLEDNLEAAADDDGRISNDTSSKCFHLLNALSDLMMLPKDLLLSRTVRKEVCPTFGPPLIRRVLNFFVPDEFCPDAIPAVVLEALNTEDPFDSEGGCIMNFPCGAAPIVYQPPSAASVTSFLGEIDHHHQLTRSRSSVLRKSQTSDDELDELDSPLKSIISDSLQASPSSAKPGWTLKENGSRNPLRYQLLRDVWMDE